MAENRALWTDIERDLASAKLDAQRAAVRARKIEDAGNGLDADERLTLETAVRTTLHDCYTAMEAALERIIEAIDGQRPTGSDYHVQLVHRPANPIAGLRPAIISDATAAALQVLRGFRRAARHVYGSFDYSRAVPNVAIAVRAVASFETDLANFADAMGLRG